jgi:hypothetical protein
MLMDKRLAGSSHAAPPVMQIVRQGGRLSRSGFSLQDVNWNSY